MRRRQLELKATRSALCNLRTFAFVAAREAAATLAVHGAYFAIGDGVLQMIEVAQAFATG